MRPAIALLALAAILTARLLRKRHVAPPPQYDDSEVVGMPTYLLTLEPDEAATALRALRSYIELAPTSRN